MSRALVRPNTDDGWKLIFSYSQLATYLICPMKYAHAYVWGTPWAIEPVAMDFGTAIHKAVGAFYQAFQETGEKMPLGEMIAAFEQHLAEEIAEAGADLLFKEGETLESLHRQGIDLLTLFHEEVTPQEIVGVEYPFQVTVPDVINHQGDLPIDLRGYFDLVESDGHGTYVVGELKTSGQRFSSSRLETDLQATVYSYALTRIGLVPSAEAALIRYDVLLKTKKPAFERYFVTRSAKDHDRLVHLINYVLKAIEHRIFFRHTGWACDGCQFNPTCLA